MTLPGALAGTQALSRLLQGKLLQLVSCFPPSPWGLTPAGDLLSVFWVRCPAQGRGQPLLHPPHCPTDVRGLRPPLSVQCTVNKVFFFLSPQAPQFADNSPDILAIEFKFGNARRFKAGAVYGFRS